MPTSGPYRKDRLPDPVSYYKQEGLRLSGSGNWRSACCPFHEHDRNPSLSIHITSGGFNCHRCGAKGGDVVDFHARKHNMSLGAAMRAVGAWEVQLSTAPHRNGPPARPRRTPEQDAARRFAKPALSKGYKPEALHAYRNERGEVLYWVIRATEPRTGNKWIRPMHLDGTRFVQGQPRFERGAKPLYNLDLLARHPDDLVLVCEGEKCADKLQKLGLLVTTSGSATSADGADWTPLAGRQVIIWPDHDEPGQRYSEDVVERLTEIGCISEVIDTAPLALGEGGDAVDWLKSHPDANRDAILRLPRRGKHETVTVETMNPAITPLHNDLETIARWCAERCIRDSRAWGGIQALYRDLCDWCGLDYAFAPGEFVCLLTEMGIEVAGKFAKGVTLACDFYAVALAHAGDYER